MQLRKLLNDAVDQLEVKDSAAARLLEEAEDKLRQANESQTQAEKSAADALKALERLEKAQDLVALAESLTGRERAVKEVETAQKLKATELAKWENKLFGIQERQDKKDAELVAREQAVAIKEREYKETAREEIVTSLVKNLTK